jgi:hypothetical protein
LKILDQLGKYKIELRHVTVLFVVLLIFQVIVSSLHKITLQQSLTSTQQWYQQDSAERLANLTATSLELLLESKTGTQALQEADVRKMVQGFNIILNQQLLHQNVQEICILVPHDTTVCAIDEGQVLYNYIFHGLKQVPASETSHDAAIVRYRQVRDKLARNEQIQTVLEGKQTFHVFVPFVPRGEFIGAVYMKNTPDFGFITREIISSYDATSLTFSALILFGLLAMFYISSYTLRARDEAQKLLFEKDRERLTEQIEHQKEVSFTKRIYHTHHKAEKITGFIKEDLRALEANNIDETKARVLKYSNFIARVIYDMKWYDPPIQTIRSPHFETDVNEVLKFLVDNVFLRVAGKSGPYRFALHLDRRLPMVPLNEFVVWEAFEPLIQNSIEHGGVSDLVITITTERDQGTGESRVIIADNGVGIRSDLLEKDERGVRFLFQENASTKSVVDQHSGYGCYIAHEMATQRCGWRLDAENLPAGGCRFVFTIPRYA